MSTAEEHETLLVPLPDSTEAGFVWRAQKLADLGARAASVVEGGDFVERACVASLLARIREVTEQVDQIGRAQQRGERETPWWADGEYDANRAASEAEAGRAAWSRGDFADAARRFTEACRLDPRRAEHHANRSAARLRLGDAAGAADDARRAVALDPGARGGHVRLCGALLALGDPAGARRARWNQGCWSDVWLMTSSVMTFRPRLWASRTKVRKSRREP